MEVIAIPIQELDPHKFMFSAKKERTWNFKDKKTGNNRSGKQIYAEVYYEKPGQKLCFMMEDLRSFSGIQTTDSFKRGFMSINLKGDRSGQLYNAVDKPIFSLCYENRHLFMPDIAHTIVSPEMLMLLYKGVVSKGKKKKDSDEFWDDSLTCNVPMKKKGQQVVVDDNLCQVEDMDGRPYAWSSLDGKTLKEVAVEVDKVTFDSGKNTVRVNCTYRLIVPDEKARPKVTTRRRLEQKSASKAVPEGGIPSAHPASSGHDDTSAKNTSASSSAEVKSTSKKDGNDTKRRRAVPKAEPS